MESEKSEQTSVQGDRVYNFFMKLFYYIGLVGFLPWVIVHMSYVTPDLLNEDNIKQPLMFLGITLIGLFAMDSVGIRSSFFDRISRLITTLAVVAGSIDSVLLYIDVRAGLSTNNNRVVMEITILIMVFEFLGWYYVRADRGLTQNQENTYLDCSVWVLLLVSLALLLEFLYPGALMIFILIVFIAYPIFIIKWGQMKVVPHIDPQKITIPYQRATLYNFIIDITKAVSIIITIIALAYNGPYLLFPRSGSTEAAVTYDWVRNLALCVFIAALSTALFTKLQEKFHGLIVIILVLTIGFIEALMTELFNYSQWAIVAILNGFTLAGIFYFIEQKMAESGNVRAMPGSFYFVVFIVMTLALAIKSSPTQGHTIEIIKGFLSLLGLVYIFGYIREAPKQKSLRYRI